MAQKDYYQILNVARTASSDEIKKAYRKLAMKYHPDKNPGNKNAEEKFKEATEAYDALSDPERRKMYDQFGHTGPSGFGGGPGAQGPFGGGFKNYGPQGGQQGFGQSGSAHDVFSDFFSDFFGNTNPGTSSRRGAKFSSQGADLRYTLNISYEDAATGCDKVISFVRQRGHKEETAKLSITVPAGVKNGQRLKLKNEGDKGPRNTKAGDLFVVVTLQDHPLFNRVENDVHMKLPLSFTDALLGNQVTIPTLIGQVNLRVPAYTMPGQIFRLKGKGFPSLDGNPAGDMLVKTVIDIPDKLTKEQTAIVKKLSENTPETPLVKEFKEKTAKLLKVRK